MYALVCMAFDGDTVTEGQEFSTIEAAWNRSEDMGSRWYFFPFHFVTTANGKTIKEAPYLLEHFEGRRVKTVSRIFEATSQLPEAQNMGPEEFALLLQGVILT